MSAVQGNRGSGAADRGSPVKTGGVYNSTQPTLSDGQRGDTQIDTRANTKISIWGRNSTTGQDVTTTSSDDVATTNGYSSVLSAGYLFDGGAWDRSRAASASVLVTKSGLGVGLVTGPGNFTVATSASMSQIAVASISAFAGIRHICTGFAFSVASGSAAPTIPSTPVRVVVRDGGTGAGTILHDLSVSMTAVAGQMVGPFSFTGLNLVGSISTAMTVEFTAAITSAWQSVNLIGFDAS